MKTAGKAVIVILGEQARARGKQDNLLHVANRCDPQLARLMRRVADAQRQLDAYVLDNIPPNTYRDT